MTGYEIIPLYLDRELDRDLIGLVKLIKEDPAGLTDKEVSDIFVKLIRLGCYHLENKPQQDLS